MSMTENNDKPVSQARTEPLRTEKLGAVPHRTTPENHDGRVDEVCMPKGRCCRLQADTRAMTLRLGGQWLAGWGVGRWARVSKRRRAPNPSMARAAPAPTRARSPSRAGSGV